MKHILKCELCGKYTMNEKCSCGGKALNPKPAKYNPDDPYGDYRRKVKESKWKKEGLL